MTQDNKLIAFYLLLILGLGIGLTNLFAPVHELGHYICAVTHGQEAEIVSWNTTTCDPNISQALAGWWFEYLVFASLALVLGWAGHYQGGKCFLGAFPFGYAIVTWFRGYGSSDMNEYVEAICKIESLNGEQTQSILKSVSDRWTIVCTIGTVIMLACFVHWLKAKKKGS